MGGETVEKPITSSVKHGEGSVMARAGTADRSNGMNSDVYGAILSAWIQTNASKLTEQRFTVQMDND